MMYKIRRHAIVFLYFATISFSAEGRTRYKYERVKQPVTMNLRKQSKYLQTWL